MKLNLADKFFERALQHPDAPLIFGPEPNVAATYSEFAATVRVLAEKLIHAGVRQGDNIGLLYPSGRDYIALVYAAWTCGACVTPLPIDLTAHEKRQIFQFIHIDGVIADSRIISHLDGLIHPGGIAVAGHAVYAKGLPSCEAPPQLADVNAGFIRFTSGTTGSAKGVVLSHESIYERIHAANQVLNIGPADRIMWVLSMDYHFTVSIVAYMTFGAAIVLPRNSFGITLIETAARHSATIIYASPTHYKLMVQDDSGAALADSLRLTIVTTSSLKSDIAAAFHQRFGQVLNEAYGIIELGLPAINASNRADKQGSVGRILPDYELRLLREPGEPHGEITLRGKGMLDAYYFPWKSRNTMLQETGGWFRTGDLGKLDDDGYLYIVGRVKEMISVAGMKFFPDEVESVLESHPAIRAACVFGMQERLWGEACVAHLELRDAGTAPSEDELRAHCKRFLAEHKIPRRFQVVERLKYTASGKKLRNAAQLIEN